ncbi:MAG: LacI family transcriptional regulator [Rhodospirillaceae bacterium]|nr:LacI family transcriptional regulator [Rhodospirillaceae bacterium]
MRMHVTQKDIADALGISRVTVTKALKDHPDIAEGTIKRIKDMAKELGYYPNFIASSLSSKRSNLIGAIFPKINHSFFSNAIESVYKAATERGFEILPMISFEDASREIRMVATLLSMRVAGIIVAISQGTKSNEIYKNAKKLGVPVVFLDRTLKDESFSSVTINDYKAAYDVIEYAISIGYKKIAYLAGYSHINIGIDRCNGFKAALEGNGISINPAWIIEGGFTPEFGYEGLKKLSNASEMPELIFAVNDSVAHGIYKAADELSIKIPDDLGVIGCGDIEHSQLLSPPLTSVHMPIESMACKAVEVLIDEINNPGVSECQHLVNETEIRIRESILPEKRSVT